MRGLLTGFLCVLASPALAAQPDAARPGGGVITVGDWTFIGNSDTTVMFFKPVAAGGLYPRVMVRFEDGEPFTRENFTSLAALEVDDIDCARRRTRIISSVRYTQHNLTGESRPDAIDPTAWKSEAAGSFGAGLIAKVCATLQ